MPEGYRHGPPEETKEIRVIPEITDAERRKLYRPTVDYSASRENPQDLLKEVGIDLSHALNAISDRFPANQDLDGRRYIIEQLIETARYYVNVSRSDVQVEPRFEPWKEALNAELPRLTEYLMYLNKLAFEAGHRQAEIENSP